MHPPLKVGANLRTNGGKKMKRCGFISKIEDMGDELYLLGSLTIGKKVVVMFKCRREA